MMASEILNNVLRWVLGQMLQFKKDERGLASQSVVQHKILEARQQRQNEEIKPLRLKNELQFQRERLGRDLHDGFGSQLTHLISRLDLLAYASDQDQRQLLSLSEFARQMNQTLRETIWLLDQEWVTVKDFGARLHGLLLRIWEDRETPMLDWRLLHTAEGQEIQPLEALHLIRITQEATNNALKYACASQVSVRLEVSKLNLQLTITDDGLGFDASSVNEGFGLANMRKRTEEVKGTFYLQTGTSGTCIEVIIPKIG